MNTRLNTRQKGLYTVEFAIVGAALFMIVFGAIEVARAMFAYNTIAEATRRGARVAAVCSPGDWATARRAAVFGTADGESPILKGLTTDMVNVVPVTDPETGATVAVQVSITGYEHRLLIPFVNVTLGEEVFTSTTTIPAESLGYAPDPGTNPCSGA
ncbi:MAG: TadE/TadG family type IV pilus assembly protein [Gammaproteobacteria bacterium]